MARCHFCGRDGGDVAVCTDCAASFARFVAANQPDVISGIDFDQTDEHARARYQRNGEGRVKLLSKHRLLALFDLLGADDEPYQGNEDAR